MASMVTDILRRARAVAPELCTHIGIKTLRPKRSATGDMLLEIPGADSSRKADELAAYLRGFVEEEAGVRVTRPVRRVELRIADLDDTITPEEMRSARMIQDAARTMYELAVSGCPEAVSAQSGSGLLQPRGLWPRRRRKFVLGGVASRWSQGQTTKVL